jgi:hypothetical protein
MNSSFPFDLSSGTKVSALDAYLANANASKTFTMVFQFSKEMDKASVENLLNWKIGRTTGANPGQAYNFGLPVPATEIRMQPYPAYVSYDSKAWTATVSFRIQQNGAADGTIDPSHIQFTFLGKDQFGVVMDPENDQFTGFSGIA